MVYPKDLRTLRYDGRVLKEAQTLIKAGHDVIIACDDRSFDVETIYVDGVGIKCAGTRGRKSFEWLADLVAQHVVHLFSRAFLDRGLSVRPMYIGLLLGLKADVYHAHDLSALPSALFCARMTESLCVYDSHEFFPGEKNYKLRRFFIRFFEGSMIRRCDAVITVNDSIAGLLKKIYSLEKEVVVLRNFRKQTPLARSNLLRENLGIPPSARILIYHGNLSPDRGVEKLVDVAKQMPEVHVVMVGNGVLRDSLMKRARSEDVKNISFRDRIKQEDLMRYLSSADVGLHPIENTCPNNYYSLGNKIGDYIMAGIPIAASDFPEMRKIILGEDIGVVFDPDDIESIVKALRSLLSSDAYEKKRRNVLSVREKYSWENEEKKLVRLYRALGKKRLSARRRCEKEVSA